MTDKKYYISLFVPRRSTLETIAPELCLLHNILDFLSDDKNYCVDLGYVFSGQWLIMIHLTVYGIDLEPFIVYRKNKIFEEVYPKFRLWTIADGYIIDSEETDWESHKYLPEGKEVISWKGRNYRGR